MKIAIVGAGAAGLAAAYDLTRGGHAVTVYEATAQVGGLAGGFKAPGWDWAVDKFYHHWFESDTAAFDLIREIGLGDQIIFPPQKTVVYHQGKFYPLDASLGTLLQHPALDKLPGAGLVARGLLALSYPGLTLSDKIRYGLIGVYLIATPRWEPLEQVTAHEWMQRWQGARGYAALWEPLLLGKFGENHYRNVNMAWFWARAHKRSARLGTFVGGFQAFFDAVAEQVRKQGGIILLNTPAMRIQSTPVNGNIQVYTAAAQTQYDTVIVTISPHGLLKLAPDLPPMYADQVQQLKSMGAVVVTLALKQALSTQGFYWHNLPKGPQWPFLALVEHTNYVRAEHFGGQHIIYCGDYVEPDHEYFQLSKQELVARFMPTLKQINPAFQPDWIMDSWLFREAYAQPVPPVNHARHIPAIQTPIPGLYFASMSQVYPWDRGTNYAVELGRRVAQLATAGE